MKTILATFAACAVNASAMAHASALPHAHEGAQTNWLPAIGASAAVALFVAGARFRRRAAKRSRR